MHGSCLPLLHSKVLSHYFLSRKAPQAFQDRRLEAEFSMDSHPIENISDFLAINQDRVEGL